MGCCISKDRDTIDMTPPPIINFSLAYKGQLIPVSYDRESTMSEVFKIFKGKCFYLQNLFYFY